MKIKNKNFKKYKNKKFIFFRPKLGQEIKIRKNPEKSKKILPNILTKNLSFFDRFSLTHSGGSSVPLLGRIHASGHLSNNKELVHFHSQSTTKY